MPKNLAKCPCCSSQQIKMLYENISDKSYFIEGFFSLYRCSNCKLEFLNPQLNEKELSKYYPSYYYSFKNKNKQLSIPDAIGYIIANRLNIKFLTGDEAFRNIENVEFVK